MELVLSLSRPKPIFWAECAAAEALLTGKPVHIAASTQEQATRMFDAVSSLFNGRGPQGAEPG